MRVGKNEKTVKLEPKIIREYLLSLLASENSCQVAGYGILINTRIGFDEEKLLKNKKIIARIIQRIGLDEKRLIPLSSLTILKNGDVWNKIDTIEDFQALDLFVACLDACGFIYNGLDTIQRNINLVGEVNSVIISGNGRTLVGDDNEWLTAIRQCVIGAMYYTVNIDNIKESLNTDMNVETNKKSK